MNTIEVYDQNNEMLGNVGSGSLSVQAMDDPVYQAMDRVRKARGLVLRALVVWLLLVLVINLLN